MTSSRTETLWNFSDVYSLLDTLSRSSRSPTPSGGDPAIQYEPQTNPNTAEELDAQQRRSSSSQPPSKKSAGLGDFSQIWQYLGTPVEAEALDLSTSPTLEKRVPIKIEYTSDGAVCTVPSSAKKLQWRDEVNDGTLTDVAPTQSDHDPIEKLSKKQKKKLAKRKGTPIAAKLSTVSDMESDADIPSPSKNPAARASVHSMKASHSTMPSSKPSKLARAGYGTDGSYEDLEEEYDPIAQQLADASRTVLARYNSEPPESKESRKTTPPTKKEWPVSNPTSAQALAFLPGTMRPRKSPKSETTAVTETTTPTRASGSRQAITPKIIRSGTDRHWAFLLKLIANFYEDRASLIAPANLSNHSSDPSGIHVFVDASNIFIGFHDQLKRARGIPTSVRVPRVDMSFDALALLLERRRPVAKRVLAGSTPEVPAFDIARRIGYECSILDKVYKARELTSRQRYFINRDKQAAKAEDGYSSGGGSAASLSGDANVVPTHAPSKFVEQGVDEILHLKMLESVVDAADNEEGNPHPTMVLATGDAAQAEYSSGFMVMVERALKRGWNVELVSWSANISSAYRRDEFLRKWTGRFKIVELDDYAEELLDM